MDAKPRHRSFDLQHDLAKIGVVERTDRLRRFQVLAIVGLHVVVFVDDQARRIVETAASAIDFSARNVRALGAGLSGRGGRGTALVTHACPDDDLP